MTRSIEEMRAFLSIDAAEERERNAPKNLVPMNIWSAVCQASGFLEMNGIKHLLIGSCAVAAQGIETGIPDIDFLGDRSMPLPPPAADWDIETVSEGYGGLALRSLRINGIKVDCINDDRTGEGWRDKFLYAPCLDIDGIRVATLHDVIAIKQLANRSKDKKQIQEWIAKAEGEAAAVVDPPLDHSWKDRIVAWWRRAG